MVLGCAGMAGGSRISRKRRFRSRRPAGVQRPSGQLPWFSAGMAPIETNPRASGRLSTTADRVVTLEWAGMGCGGCILPAIVRSATRPDRCIPRSAAVRGIWARRDANNKAQRWPNDICGGRASKTRQCWFLLTSLEKQHRFCWHLRCNRMRCVGVKPHTTSKLDVLLGFDLVRLELFFYHDFDLQVPQRLPIIGTMSLAITNPSIDRNHERRSSC